MKLTIDVNKLGANNYKIDVIHHDGGIIIGTEYGQSSHIHIKSWAQQHLELFFDEVKGGVN